VALLIACEMLARGEIKRLCVLCPPYLCDQWQRELYRKANLVFVPSRFDVYRAVSRQIHTIFADYIPLVEPLSLDEAYLDVTENRRSIANATATAAEIASARPGRNLPHSVCGHFLQQVPRRTCLRPPHAQPTVCHYVFRNRIACPYFARTAPRAPRPVQPGVLAVRCPVEEKEMLIEATRTEKARFRGDHWSDIVRNADSPHRHDRGDEAICSWMLRI
jgi:hypothetical protein